LDASFNPQPNSNVTCFAVQPDGKILVGGEFTALGGQARNRLARLNSNGSLDDAFNPGADQAVQSFALQTDGKIILAGAFTVIGGRPHSRIARLNADGTLDNTFNATADNGIGALAVQADGKVLLGGYFTTLSGQPRAHIARLNSTDLATQSVLLSGSKLTWLRGGASPEVWSTTFDCSTNSGTWLRLGEGVRIPGGWQLSAATMPAKTTIRARGYIAGGGQYNGSSWFVETITVVSNTPITLNLDSSGFIANRFGFGLNGPAGQTVVVETSTDLCSWLPVQTNVLGLESSYFSESIANTTPQRFYRLRIP
jgi:uncharacterized delta-60 repeat protein